jgi:hypothetical protein
MSTLICQINGTLPSQCCGLPADQIYRCEQVAPPGHQCQVGDHTILHERMGNGYACSAVEQQLTERDGLRGWVSGTSFVRIGATR